MYKVQTRHIHNKIRKKDKLKERKQTYLSCADIGFTHWRSIVSLSQSTLPFAARVIHYYEFTPTGHAFLLRFSSLVCLSFLTSQHCCIELLVLEPAP